ncbi:MAG: hypothetical protein JWP25_8323 [Bradyrhizobium sp.]|nr:hypothetical protein [Bradyrhizobium sp.]
MNELNQASNSRGLFSKHGLNSIPGVERLHGRVVCEIVKAVAELRGNNAAQRLRSGGLEILHTVVSAQELGPIREKVLGELRDELMAVTAVIGRTIMGWQDDFYVDDYLILRINFPYEIAKQSDFSAENPGTGRLTPSVRAIAMSRRVKDPIYDPKSYHRGHPPAAWAHGPHIDSWTGHSKDGLNVWWAMCDVPAEASVVLYPELAGAALPSDRRTLYLAEGFPLPTPTFIPLLAGEILIFDPEILHGTHLNVSDQTRVAVSMRLNAVEPVFDPECFYAREFWRKASDIESGHFDRVLHLRREDHLAPRDPVTTIVTPKLPRRLSLQRGGEQSTVSVGPSSSVGEGEKIVAELTDCRVLISRNAGKLYACSNQCPHYGVSLTDGAIDGKTIYCPACAVSFDLESGRSACPSLSIERFSVEEIDGSILLYV